MKPKKIGRHITKVKWDGKKVTIAYMVLRAPGDDEDPDTYRLTSGDPPKKRFIEALHALDLDVGVMCDIPEKHLAHWIASVTPRGVSFSWKDGIMGAVITALKTLDDSRAPLVINTPHKPEKPYSAGDVDGERYCLQAGTVEKLQAIIDRALEYLDGDREQLRLFQAQEKKASGGGKKKGSAP